MTSLRVKGVGKEGSDKENQSSRKKGQWRDEDTLVLDERAVGGRKRWEVE